MGGDKVVAYLFSTLDIIAAPGYSTTPFDVIAGVDLLCDAADTPALAAALQQVTDELLEPAQDARLGKVNGVDRQAVLRRNLGSCRAAAALERFEHPAPGGLEEGVLSHVAV